MIKYSSSTFESQEKARQFVKECEREFELRLSSVAKSIAENKNIKVIGLAGPTCSGKTTASKKLVDVFEELSRRVNIISIDDFYYDKEYLHRMSIQKGMASVDYESADTIDIPLLESFIENIFDKGHDTVSSPIYDFVKGCRDGYREMKCTDKDIFVFEGIQVLYPQIRKLFDTHPFCGIYISTESSIMIDDIKFEPCEIRLLRRIVRDCNFRATSADITFELWQNVRKNEEENIFPYIDFCMYKIDSVFACEISLLRPYLSEILSRIKPGSKWYSAAQEILKKIQEIESLPSEYISTNSLYQEFI